MDVINIGSLNLDWVYQVPHFVQAGETLHTASFNEYVGGKGLNQSIALARAGCQVAHVGAIGHNGDLLLNALQIEGVNTDFVSKFSGPSGHAMIQVTPQGENAIIVFPGTNHQLSLHQIQSALEIFAEAKIVLLQNETNFLKESIEMAKQAGKYVVYNPAPMIPEVEHLPLDKVDVLILNQIEAHALTHEVIVTHQCQILLKRWPHLIVVLTQGGDGVTVARQNETKHYAAVPVTQIVDTTAAGDTFIGYFIAEYLQTEDLSSAVKLATRAASISITQAGAAQSIPLRSSLG